MRAPKGWARQRWIQIRRPNQIIRRAIQCIRRRYGWDGVTRWRRSFLHRCPPRLARDGRKKRRPSRAASIHFRT